MEVYYGTGQKCSTHTSPANRLTHARIPQSKPGPCMPAIRLALAVPPHCDGHMSTSSRAQACAAHDAHPAPHHPYSRESANRFTHASIVSLASYTSWTPHTSFRSYNGTNCVYMEHASNPFPSWRLPRLRLLPSATAPYRSRRHVAVHARTA